MRPLPTELRGTDRALAPRFSLSRALTAARWIQAQCPQRVSVPAHPHHHVLTSATHSTPSSPLVAPAGAALRLCVRRASQQAV